jgi:hypothetical protein
VTVGGAAGLTIAGWASGTDAATELSDLRIGVAAKTDAVTTGAGTAAGFAGRNEEWLAESELAGE